jgi:hypothetical protein
MEAKLLPFFFIKRIVFLLYEINYYQRSEPKLTRKKRA